MPKIERVRTRAEIEKEWIRTRQGADGRLFMNGGGTTNPYFACLAAQGLLSGHVSDADLDAVGRYIDWHCRKFMEWNGDVPDFSVVDNVESAEKPDSVDAYVAVFLSLLCQKAQITKNMSKAESGVLSQGMRKLDELSAGGLTSVMVLTKFQRKHKTGWKKQKLLSGKRCGIRKHSDMKWEYRIMEMSWKLRS